MALFMHLRKLQRRVSIEVFHNRTYSSTLYESWKVHGMIQSKNFSHLIGFGTYQLLGSECEKVVTRALHLGYPAIDTATFYNNFSPIKMAISDYKRDEISITSKVWPDSQTPELLEKDLTKTLRELNTNYIDNYLLHWPNSTISIKKILMKLNFFKENSLVRFIGLSNVTVNHLKRISDLGCYLDTVQVEMNPLFYDSDLLAYCHKNKITIQAWAPLGRGRIMNNKILESLSKKYKKSNAQIALRWIIQHQCIPFPCSTNESHQQDNLDICDFSLSEQDMLKIDKAASTGKRERVVEKDNFGFTDEFEHRYDECWPTT